MEVLGPFRYMALWMSKRHTVTPEYVITVYNDMFEHGGDVVVGKRLPLLQSHAFEWVRDWVRVIEALHHAIDKVE
jgi:hypothetical protein